MELTAFNSRLGISQGRIPLEENEEFVFVLGDDVAGYVYNLEVGDFVQVAQETDLTDIDLVRTELTVRVPESTPPAVCFEVSILVNNTKYAATACPASRARHITDLAANVSKLSGTFQVAVRLEVRGA